MKKGLETIYISLVILISIVYSSNILSNKYLMILMLLGIIIVLILSSINIKSLLKSLYNKKEVALLLALAISYTISIVVTKGASFRELYAVFIILFGLCFVGSEVAKRNTIGILTVTATIFLVLSFCTGLFGLYCYYNDIVIADGYGCTGGAISINAITSIFNSPNGYAFITVVAVALSVIMIAIKRSKLVTIILSLNIFFQLYIMWLTGSRTAILTIGSFFAIYILLFWGGKYKKYVISTGLFLIFIVILMVKFNLLPENSSIMIKFANADISSGRFELWSGALGGIKDNLLFGVGIRNSIPTIGHYLQNSDNTLGTHNGYLGVLLANGLIFFTILITYIGYSLMQGYNKCKIVDSNSKIILQLLITFVLMMLVSNITESVLFGDINFPSIIMWSMLVLVKNYNRTYSEI